MDDLFVKRPRDPSSNAADPHAGARQMVQEMVDIVLDESPDKVSLSPDEQRLRGAGRSAPRQSDADSWAEALDEASKIHDDGDDGFVDAPANMIRGPEPIVDGLFARRREPNPADGAADRPQNREALKVPRQADDLFFQRPQKQDIPAIAIDDGTDAEDGECAEDDEEECASDGEATESRRPCCRVCACCHRKCACLVRCLPECGSARCSESLPNRATLAKYGGGSLLFIGLLALGTIGLAMGCEPDAPLGRVCISEGPVQWVIAFLPVTLLSCTAFMWFRISYKTRVEEKQESWQHDGEAQKSAAELLDTLAAAPVAERHKYAAQAVQVLKDFPEKAIIQHKGCAALEAICRAQRGNVQHVHAAGAVPTILRALDTHLRVRKVQSSGLSALACLAKISKQQIFDLGGIETILRSMTKFKRDPGVQVSGAMALGALCLASEQQRRSVARFGGISVLLQALERHVERADVLIAASETLALIAQDNQGLQKQLLSSLPIIQSIVERYEGAKRAAVRPGAGKQAEKKLRDCEIVLRSLRKLEGRLADLAEVDEDDACSDVATPRLDANQEGTNVMQANGQKSAELMGRLNVWKKT